MATIFAITVASMFVGAIVMVLSSITALYVNFSSKSLHRRFNDHLLALLFITHTTTGVFNVLIPILIWHRQPWPLVDSVSAVRDCNACLEVTLTIILSIERYVAIRKPFFYARLGKFHAALFMTISMIFPLAFSIWRAFSMSVFFLGCLVTISGGIFISASNIYLYRSVRKQCKGINNTIVDRSENRAKDRKNELRKRKLRSLKICIYITVSYLLTWFPLVIVITLQVLLGIDQNWTFIFAVIGFSNGIWDVLIFFHLNQKARKRLLVLLYLNRNKIDPVQSSFQSSFISTSNF